MSTPITRLRSLRRGRAIHLLDIENLAGSPVPTTEDVQRVMGAYRHNVPVGPLDQFIVAVNHNALVPVGVAMGLALGGVQLLVRSGPDGADRALDEAARTDRIDLRFERAVIGSGDGFFADLAVWLAGRGLHVTVVSQRDHLSWRLYTAVPDTVTFELPVARAA
ncbi:hypothetical protein [Microbispora sp. NPDC046933]|uniref:hypothetical protein n=1 Tax=Microbispora sp. NPDC046933 TaxID=3155618 RepID=UPI0033F1895C